MAYARPVLCRLCRFPAPDAGVPVSEVDREKLSEWCLRTMDTELDEEGLDEGVFCHFCMSDASFEHQVLDDMSRSGSGWWKRAEQSNLEKFYLEDKIQPCSVQIEVLSSKQIKELTKRPPLESNNLNFNQEKKKVYKCLYCPVELHSKEKLKKHATQTHKKRPIFTCKVCLEMFKSKSEKQDHYMEQHRDKFICIYCGACWKHYVPYNIHMQNVHQKEAIQCKYTNKCILYFKTEAEREEHIEKVHESGTDKIRCLYCNKCIRDRDFLRHIKCNHRLDAIRCDHIKCPTYFLTQVEKVQHLKEVHRSKKVTGRFKCIYCSKMVSQGTSKYGHFQKYHKAEVLKCNFKKNCPTYFHTEDERQRHIQDVHEARLLAKVQCIYCKQIYSDYMRLRDHVKHMHSEVMIKCKWRGCQNYFHSHTEHNEHFQQTHAAQEQEKTHQCRLCSFKTKSSSSLQSHFLTKHGDDNLQCSRCPKVFKSQLLLAKHTRHKHLNRLELEKCTFCHVEVSCLYQHARKKKCLDCNFVSNCASQSAHHQEVCDKKHKCKSCNKTFKYKRDRDTHVMKEHMRRNEVESNSCKLCHHTCSSKEELKMHLRSSYHLRNIQNAPFTCNFCHKLYPSLSKIRAHLQCTHLQTTAYPCPKCGKISPSLHNLRKHLHFVHDDQNYVECDLCNAVIRSRCLKNHRIGVHQIFEN